MEMESAFMKNVSNALNASGRAVVTAYDSTISAFGKLFTAIKQEAPIVSEKTKGMFTKGFGFMQPGEISSMEKKIKEYEQHIKELYFEIGKEGSKVNEGETPLEVEAVKKLIFDVRNYEKEIERIQKRIVEVKEEKEAEILKKKEERKTLKAAKFTEKAKKSKVSEDEIKKLVEAAIAKALKSGEFENLSEQEILGKVANDLLDSEIEIKCLAAAELGKMKNVAAVPILMEAVKFDNPDLTSEAVNSLIAIGDARAVSIFKDQIKSQKHSVRIGCLRGLYKLADDETAMQILTESLRDDHPEVRRNALTFIGWKDYALAVPSVIQCLRDEEPRVRKAAVSALANLKDEASVLPLISSLGDKDHETREKVFETLKNITGEDIKIDVHSSDKELSEAINNLKDWWQKERLGKTTTEQVVESPVVVEQTPVVETPVVVEQTPVVVEQTPVVETPVVVEQTPVVETPVVVEQIIEAYPIVVVETPVVEETPLDQVEETHTEEPELDPETSGV